MDFIGRAAELAWLDGELNLVRQAGSRAGRCVLLRGRRRVGKSRLIETFIKHAGVPSLYYTAAGVTPIAERIDFVREALDSDLPGRELFDGVHLDSWNAALRLLAAALPTDGPAVVVIDEVPYLTATETGFEGILQRIWDRVLVHRPVLLILIGSDLSMMSAINEHGRPFHQRGTPMVLDPLTPADVADLLGGSAADAIDNYLITGGLPLICADWALGSGRREFLSRSLASPTSALVVSAELSLAAEFPADANPRTVLTAIGHGERTFSSVQRATGLPSASLARALELLTRRGIVAADHPLSTLPSKETRYRTDDPYLRFWLYFIGPRLSEINRGRADRVLAHIEQGWTSWRERAVEPVIREALRRVPSGGGPDAEVVGAYWTRSNDVEVDLVGADRAPIARRIDFVGSVKWHEDQPFDARDLAALIVARDRVPGTDRDTSLIAVSRVGGSVPGAAASYGADDVLSAWRR